MSLTQTLERAEEFDPSAIRKLMGRYPTGVAIVTAHDEAGGPVGLVVGSFGSVSLDPFLVGFYPAKTSTSWPKIEKTGRFSVNVLAAAQSEMCDLFFRSKPERFASFGSDLPGFSGPIARASLFAMECAIAAVHDAGDHLIVLGKVEKVADLNSGAPLLFCEGGFGAFLPG